MVDYLDCFHTLCATDYGKDSIVERIVLLHVNKSSQPHMMIFISIENIVNRATLGPNSKQNNGINA